MKASILFLAGIIFLVFSCEQKRAAENKLLGVWKLTEALMDPGDGSGTFKPTDKAHKLTFKVDGKLWIDEDLFCRQGTKLFDLYNGEYDTTRKVVILHKCEQNEISPEYRYELNELNELIIYPPCIEACAYKFVKDSSE